MRRIVIGAAASIALGALAAAPQASAQRADDPAGVFGSILGALTNGEYGYWPSIDQRQAWLESQIDQGVRDGSLTRAESRRLLSQFDDLKRLEVRYRRGGLSSGEQTDLDRRFDRLAARISRQSNDRQERNWTPVDRRQRQLDARIDAGVRDGSLTRAEATRLRDQFRDLERLESRYRHDGLSRFERADLDARFDHLSSRIRAERHDGQDRGDRRASLNDRQADVEARIDTGVRNGSLTWDEARRLRQEFREIARLENDYRANGLSAAERTALDRRMDRLEAQVRAERRDWQREGAS